MPRAEAPESLDSPPAACALHGDIEAAVRCRPCGAPLCDACWRFSTADGLPLCARCAFEMGPSVAGRWPFAGAFALSSGGMILAALRWELLSPWSAGLAAAVVCAASAGIGVLWKKPEKALVVERAPADPGRARQAPGHPYRGSARRALRRVAPPVSGRATVALVASALAVAAVLVPAALRLPRWIEAEVVLAAWWLVLATSLGVLLYRGWRIGDDYPVRVPWEELGREDGARPAAKRLKKEVRGSSGSGSWDLSSLDVEGCVVLVGLLFLIGVALGAAWLLVEIVAPLVAAIVYVLVLRALSRVANDRHGCEGDVLRAALWASLWATAYVAPLALVVAGVHAILRATKG